MTIGQLNLLRRLIFMDQEYWKKVRAGELASNDDRGLEIGSINSVNYRTATSLVKLELAEIVNIRVGQDYIFLGRYSFPDNDD